MPGPTNETNETNDTNECRDMSWKCFRESCRYRRCMDVVIACVVLLAQPESSGAGRVPIPYRVDHRNVPRGSQGQKVFGYV